MNDLSNEQFDEKLDAIITQIADLKNEFAGKIKYDLHKNTLIDKLHQELQKYKDDYITQLLRPLLLDIIGMIDHINKLVANYRQQELSQVDPNKLFSLMASFPADLEDILYRQGVEPFQCPDPLFDSMRQKCINILATEDLAQDKIIVQRIRPGYEWQQKILRREMVDVYDYQEPIECVENCKDKKSEKGANNG